MELTPEQTTADERLITAIDRQHQAYGVGAQGVITKYIVVAQRQWIDQDEEFHSEVFVTTEDTMSMADALGLAEFAGCQFRKMITDQC